MHITAAPPQHVQMYSGFDYVTVDSARGRVYAAHTGSQALLIVDAHTGKVEGQVEVGTMHGVAVDPQTGDVFTGDGVDRTIAKVDPVSMKVVGGVQVAGPVDAITYDPGLHRIYADEDNGSRIFVVDGATMKLIATITVPSSDLEAPSVDPKTHRLYQNMNDKDAYAVIDPKTLRVLQIVKTPQLQHNHPLAFDPAVDEVIVGGKNGLLSTYTPDGKHIADVKVQEDIDQCSLDQSGELYACAGSGTLSVVRIRKGHAPMVVAEFKTPHDAIHTIGIDDRTNDLWVVWSDLTGDYVQRLKLNG